MQFKLMRPLHGPKKIERPTQCEESRQTKSQGKDKGVLPVTS